MESPIVEEAIENLRSSRPWISACSSVEGVQNKRASIRRSRVIVLTCPSGKVHLQTCHSGEGVKGRSLDLTEDSIPGSHVTIWELITSVMIPAQPVRFKPLFFYLRSVHLKCARSLDYVTSPTVPMRSSFVPVESSDLDLNITSYLSPSQIGCGMEESWFKSACNDGSW